MDEQVKARLIGATVLVLLAVALVPEMLSGPKSSDSQAVDGNGKRATRTYTIDLGATTSEAARLAPAPANTTTRTATPPLPTVAPPGVSAGKSADAPDSVPAAPGSPASPTASAPTPGPAAGAAMRAPDTGAAPPKPTSPATAVPASTPSAANVATNPKTAPAATAQSGVTSPKGSWAVQVGAFGSNDTARKQVSALNRDGYPAYVAPLNRSGKTLYRVRVGPVATRPDAEKLAVRLKSRGTTGAVVAAD